MGLERRQAVVGLVVDRDHHELGLVTDDERLLDVTQARFDRIWRGGECPACRMRSVCPRPVDSAAKGKARCRSSD